MTRAQAEELVKAWAEYQLGHQDTRIGPKDFSAPMLSESGPPSCNLAEYQFVQREIEVWMHKAYDRAMAVAILQSWFWHGRPLQTALMGIGAQRVAVDAFLGRLMLMRFVRSEEKTEIVA